MEHQSRPVIAFVPFLRFVFAFMSLTRSNTGRSTLASLHSSWRTVLQRWASWWRT